MIKYYFGGKQGLFTEVVLEDIVAAKECFKASVADAQSPTDQLGAFIESLGSLAGEKPLFLQLLSRELIGAGRHLEPHVEDEFFGFFGVVREILQQGITAGDFRPVDPHAMHLSIVGGLVWFALTEPLRQRLDLEGRSPAPSPTWTDYVEHFRDLTLRSLETEPSERTAPSPDLEYESTERNTG